MSNIVKKNDDIVIISKGVGVPSQPDKSGAPDAMSMTGEELSSLGEKSTLYPIHRLDRGVGGLLLFARNKKSAAELSAKVSGEGIGKEYFAILEGVPELCKGRLTDYLIKDSVLKLARVASKDKKDAKLAVLDYELLATAHTPKCERSLVRVRLSTGRFHQIRAQFSSRGLSLLGDRKYGSREVRYREPALFAYRLSFELFGKSFDASALPDLTAYPWSLFSSEFYK